jgi:hypothetical protein
VHHMQAVVGFAFLARISCRSILSMLALQLEGEIFLVALLMYLVLMHPMMVVLVLIYPPSSLDLQINGEDEKNVF